MLPEAKEIAIIVKEYRSGRLLVIRIVAWVENLNARFLSWLHQPWGDTVARGTGTEIYRDNVRVDLVFLQKCHFR